MSRKCSQELFGSHEHQAAHVGEPFDATHLREILRHDSLFAENEESLDIEALKCECEDLFEFKMEKYVGSAAYLLVLNSMIFRVPLWLKRVYSPALMWLEKMLLRFHSRRLSLAVICQWEKK